MRGCIPDSVSLRFEFVSCNSSFEPILYSDHFGCVCVVAFQIRFRYVSNLFHKWLKFRARIILVANAAWLIPDSVLLRFEFSFMNGLSFEPILGSFWSRMRSCIPDSVLLRFEFVS